MFAVVSPAIADKLPDGAKPLLREPVVNLYSGNSTNWSNSRAYFAPNGTVVGLFGKPNATHAYSGHWTTKKNIVCMEVQGVDLKTMKKGKRTSTDC